VIVAESVGPGAVTVTLADAELFALFVSCVPEAATLAIRVKVPLLVGCT